MTKHACVRTDNMSGTTLGKDLVSLQYGNEIENGCVLAIGDLIEGEREVYEGTAPAATATLGTIALVASPEVIKDKKMHSLADFINKENAILRGYVLRSGDIFSVTKEAFATGSNLEGTIVELNGGTKLALVETNTGTTVGSDTTYNTIVGNVIAVENDWYVIKVA